LRGRGAKDRSKAFWSCSERSDDSPADTEAAPRNGAETDKGFADRRDLG